MKSIFLVGIGGEGIKTAGEILCDAFVIEDYYVIGMPHFGPERRGSIVKYIIKFDKKPILERDFPISPNYIVSTRDFFFLYKYKSCFKFIFKVSPRNPCETLMGIKDFIKETKIIKKSSFETAILDHFRNRSKEVVR